MIKICRFCKLEKPLEEFRSLHSSVDGKKSECKVCARVIDKEHRDKHKESRNLYNREYRKTHKKETKEYNAKYVNANLNKFREYNEKSRNKNIEATRAYNNKYYLIYKVTRSKTVTNNIIAYQKSWNLQNSGKKASYLAVYRSSKLQATPKWLTKFDVEYMRHLYIQAKELKKLDGVPREVDHIIPLQGKTVCGLHVPWNLQILTKEQNASKGNRL